MESSSDDRRVREVLEVSRPGDLADTPDVAQAIAQHPPLGLAFQRIQQWDTALSAALDRIDIPVGLEQRLLARLSKHSHSDAEGGILAAAMAEVTNSSSNAVSGLEREVTPARRPDKRGVRPLAYWSGVGLSAVAAAALVIAAGYWLQLGTETPLDQLADQWQQKLSDEWHPIASAPPEFPFPDAMRVAATGWQWIGKLTPTPVVAYRLTDGKATAHLYAARMTREGLGKSPPTKVQQDTGGKAIAYWRSPQKSNVMYVLVVDDAKRYHHFVRAASTPLAVLLPLPFNTRPGHAARPTAHARKIA
jgi:hypothetical protein